jgi:hypothetical protein
MSSLMTQRQAQTQRRKNQKKRNQTKKRKVIIPISSSGEMAEYGYYNVKSLTVKERHDAIERMIEKESKRLQISQEEKIRSIILRLNALAIVTKNRNPKVSKIFREDQQWLSRKLDRIQE